MRTKKQNKIKNGISIRVLSSSSRASTKKLSPCIMMFEMDCLPCQTHRASLHTPFHKMLLHAPFFLLCSWEKTKLACTGLLVSGRCFGRYNDVTSPSFRSFLPVCLDLARENSKLFWSWNENTNLNKREPL